MFRRTLTALLLGLAFTAASAQSIPGIPRTPPPPDAEPPPPREPEPEPEPVAAASLDKRLLNRIGDLFGGDLPQLDVPGTIKVILRPHFGDLVRRDYMRVDTGLRWSLNERFEVSTAASVYFTHGFDDSAGNGIGKVRLGSKYVFEVWPHPDYETTIGFNFEAPTGHPPIDMTDGHYHFSPNIVVQTPSKRIRHLTLFAGAGLDLLKDSSIAGTWGTNQPHDDSIAVTAGGVYDVGQLKWTLTSTYATTALIGDETKHFFYLEPGVLWYVPSRYTFNSRTQWIVGLGARTTWGPDGFDFSLRSRIRAEITFRQVMDKFRKRPSSSR